jgi:hypothetical protein
MIVTGDLVNELIIDRIDGSTINPGTFFAAKADNGQFVNQQQSLWLGQTNSVKATTGLFQKQNVGAWLAREALSLHHDPVQGFSHIL